MRQWHLNKRRWFAFEHATETSRTGFIKALLGLLGWKKVGRFGIHSCLYGKAHLKHYYEFDISKYPVQHDCQGYPIHPKTWVREHVNDAQSGLCGFFIAVKSAPAPWVTLRSSCSTASSSSSGRAWCVNPRWPGSAHPLALSGQRFAYLQLSLEVWKTNRLYKAT